MKTLHNRRLPADNFMRTLCFLIAFLLLQPCRGQTQSNSTFRSDSKNHELAELMDINVLIGKSVKVNYQKNPFLKINSNRITQNCESIEDKRAHLNCVLNSFPEYKPPIELGPIPEPKHYGIGCIDDSIFITNILKNQNFFKTPPGDRTYCHLNGIIVDRNANYILCIIPYTDCVATAIFFIHSTIQVILSIRLLWVQFCLTSRRLMAS